jgi:FkbM family methyltransferase
MSGMKNIIIIIIINMLLFDIGANIGLWSIANYENNKIIALEASPITYETLKTNCLDYPNITLLNYAVCDSPEQTITFYHADNSVFSTLNLDWLTSLNSRFCGEKYKQITCRVISLDKLVDTYGVPDLLKIDVEGGEFSCIKSLTKKVGVICFEWAAETNDITKSCINYLYELGYREFYLKYEDNYTYRPVDTDYYDIDSIMKYLEETVSKRDWGMIWCK